MDFVWEKIQVENGEPSERILIIARDFRYAQEWCRIHGINFRSPAIRFASKLDHFHGISGMYYVDLGTDDQDLRLVVEHLKMMATIKPLMTPNAVIPVTEDMITRASLVLWEEASQPYFADCRNFTDEDVTNGELRRADKDCLEKNRSLVRRALEAALQP